MNKEAIVLKSDGAGRVQMPVERQVQLVREFERSGLSGPRFAELAGVKYQTFATWRRRHGKRGGSREQSKPVVKPVFLEMRDLYASQEKLHAVVQADEERFKKALALAMPGYTQPIDPVIRLYNRFKADVRLETLAAEFGEEDARFLERLKDSRNADLESIASQLEGALGFPRASWLDQFKVIAKALNQEQLDFTPIDYTEFSSGAPKAGGNEGKVTLTEGGVLTIATNKVAYKKKELLTVKVKSTEGVFLRLYHLSAEKVLTQIFPNSARTDNFIKGGETVEIGSQKEGDLGPGEFRFRMEEPFGTEIILAVASPVQFTDTENLNFAKGEDFKSFKTERDLRESLTRGTKGLEVEVNNATGDVVGSRTAPTFTARAVFTVGPQ